MSAVLVTGANGFVGRHVMRMLCSWANVHIVATDVHPALGYEYEGGDDVTYLPGDLNDPEFALKLRNIHRYDEIIHLAASITQDVTEYDDVLASNVGATFGVLEIARAQRARVLFPSTALVYGRKPAPFTEEMVPEPEDFYSLTKLTCENMIRFYGKQFGVPAVILRIGVLYGAGQRVGFIPAVIDAMEKRREYVTNVDGQTRDYVYVGDLVHILDLLLSTGWEVAGTYNVGTGIATTMNEAARTVAAIYETPELLILGAGANKYKSAWTYCLDSSALAKVITLPAWTPLDKGLRETVRAKP